MRLIFQALHRHLVLVFSLGSTFRCKKLSIANMYMLPMFNWYWNVLYDQDAQPRSIVALWKANLDENFNQNDPTVIVSDASTSNSLLLPGTL